jgi:hypothetical protein
MKASVLLVLGVLSLAAAKGLISKSKELDMQATKKDGFDW